MKRGIGLGNSLFTFWLHGDIVDLQNSIRAALKSTDPAVSGCAVLDPNSRASWTAFSMEATNFVDGSAAWLNTGTQADTGQYLQRAVRSWQEFLQGKGCDLAGPLYEGGITPEPVSNWLKYGAIIAVAVATAVVVGEIVPFIPRHHSE
jgi:hypothetical protein